MIVVEDLTVIVADRRALDRVDLVVRRSERLGLLGRPGAGKSTLLRAIAGRIAPSAGRVAVDGRDPRRDREALGGRICSTSGPQPAAARGCDLLLVDDADPTCLTLLPDQTVVVVLPDVAAAQAVGCDRVAVLDGGRLLAHGAPTDPPVCAALDATGGPVERTATRKQPQSTRDDVET